LGLGDGVADLGGETALIVDVDVDDIVAGHGHDVLGMRNRYGEPWPVDLDHQNLPLEVEGESTTVPDTAKAARVQSS
jgi:hypothetical protein